MKTKEEKDLGVVIQEFMVLRHHNEAESLHAVQRMDWEWKLKELGDCDANSRPHIDDLHETTTFQGVCCILDEVCSFLYALGCSRQPTPASISRYAFLPVSVTVITISPHLAGLAFLTPVDWLEAESASPELPTCAESDIGVRSYQHHVVSPYPSLKNSFTNLIDMDGKRIDKKTIQAIIDLHKAGISNKEICIKKGLCTVQKKKFKAAVDWGHHKSHSSITSMSKQFFTFDPQSLRQVPKFSDMALTEDPAKILLIENEKDFMKNDITFDRLFKVRLSRNFQLNWPSSGLHRKSWNPLMSLLRICMGSHFLPPFNDDCRHLDQLHRALAIP
ncbi:hypothetical protein E2C01_010706 [Portunus trituberculatus]|uniref:Uncharacterized protein n=1 Tax=Portunus trituberculatus TaxID=210409 RepID=A0A5B7D956_PORTR|nr:hypothetical protein [Portunus trituberculatus]